MKYLVKKIRAELGLTQQEFADLLNTSFGTVNRWENGKSEPSILAQKRLLEICIDRNIDVFRLIESKISNIIMTLNIPDDRQILFHASKSGINGPILPQSRPECDFGSGFYMGTILRQPLTLTCGFPHSKFYVVSIPKGMQNTKQLQDDLDWAMFIGYNRKRMESARNTWIYKKYANLSKNVDIIIGSIADDRMYRVLDDFYDGLITDKTLISCLSVLDLGKQYVCVTKAGCQQVKIETSITLTQFERDFMKYMSENYRSEGLRLTDEIYKQHRREGKYFDELISEGANG